MIKTGEIYQGRISEIGRTLLHYVKSDSSDMYIVLWDDEYTGNDLDQLNVIGTPMQFEIDSEDDGQVKSASIITE